jgi:hypothetical protein
MGTLFVDKLDPQSGTSLEIGSSGDTITIPSGCTITNNGTQTGFGGTNTALFKAYVTGNYSVASGTETKMVFNNEFFDSNNVYDTSNGRFTAPETATYYLHGEGYVGTTASILQLIVYKNGSRLERIANIGTSSGGVFGATILSLSANDYIELYMRSADTNSYYGSTGTGELSRFEGFKLIT